MRQRAEADLSIVDARGLNCPWPVLRAERAMRAGHAFILLADDPVARTDVPLVASAWSWSCVLMPTEDEVVCFHLTPETEPPA